MSNNSFTPSFSERTKVTFKFEGRFADEGRLDSEDFEQAAVGMWRLLACHAHYFSTGRVPSTITSQGEHYAIDYLATKRGSVMVEFLVSVTGGLTVIAVHELVRAYGPFLVQNLKTLLSDDSSGRQFVEEALRRPTLALLRQIARPVGRSAASMKILVDEMPPVEIRWADLDRLRNNRAGSDDHQSKLQSEIAEFVELQKLSPVMGMPIRLSDLEIN